jgi:hypothetical protein
LIFQNFLHSLKKWPAKVFCISLLILSCLVLKEFKNGRRSVAYLSLVILFSGIAHTILGRYGWFSRYEIYAVILTWLTIIFLIKNDLNKTYFKVITVFVLIVVAYFHETIGATFKSPLAARNIYEQQYQMHRFVVDFWKRPVAVNDLGWVSYKNEFYVLDLVGLGSEDVRLSKMTGTFNSSKINDITLKNNIGLIMVYENWFNGIIPREWTKVATLQTSKVTAASDSVSFYATSPDKIIEIKKLLESFATTLPNGAKIKINP